MRRRCRRRNETDENSVAQRARTILLIDRAEAPFATSEPTTTALKRTLNELNEDIRRQTDKTIALINKLRS